MSREKEPVIHHKAGEQSAGNPFRFILSTRGPDHRGDIIEQDGWVLSHFRKNPIALFEHDIRQPIGRWEDVRVEDGKLMGTLRLASADTSPRIDEIRKLIEQRILRATSVGYRKIKAEPVNNKDPWGGIRFVKQMLLEASIVSVPANPETLSVAKSLGISREVREMTFRAVEGASTRSLSAAEIEDITGEPSSVIRARRRLIRAGLM